MKSPMLKPILMLLGAAALLAGCATQDRGALGNDSETTYLSGSTEPPVITGPNGSVSPGNPFGLGSGTGMTPQ
jgi:hypothetical protein